MLLWEVSMTTWNQRLKLSSWRPSLKRKISKWVTKFKFRTWGTKQRLRIRKWHHWSRKFRLWLRKPRKRTLLFRPISWERNYLRRTKISSENLSSNMNWKWDHQKLWMKSSRMSPLKCKRWCSPTSTCLKNLLKWKRGWLCMKRLLLKSLKVWVAVLEDLGIWELVILLVGTEVVKPFESKLAEQLRPSSSERGRHRSSLLKLLWHLWE